MKTVTLDAHSGESQMAVVMETGEVVYETRVETTREALRRVVGTTSWTRLRRTAGHQPP